MNASLVLVRLARVSCILILLAAGVLKVIDPAPVPRVVDNLGLVWMAGYPLAVVEIGLALLLMSPSVQWRRLAAMAAAMLIASGCIYLVWLRLGGTVNQCGCFGASIRLSLATHMVLNGVFLALLAALIGVDRRDGDRLPRSAPQGR